METNKSAKILVLGKTGVGKSSFINYFLGTNKAETGMGKPITTGYCIEYEYNNGKFPVKIYDNQGFEAAIADKQKEKIINFIAEQNNSENVFNWFHTIFYCTSAHHRFEDFEANFIIDLSKKISQNIHIIMTTCDGIAPTILDEKEQNIRKKLKSLGNRCHIFRVVSITKKKRDGSIVEPYGKEEISASVFKLLWEDICSKVSKEYAKELRYSMINVFNTAKYRFKTFIKENINLINLVKAIKDENYFDELDDSFNNIGNEIDNIIEECNKKYNKILSPICDLFIGYCSTVMSDSFADMTMLDFASMSQDIDFCENEAIMKYFPHAINLENLDFDNLGFHGFKEILCAVGETITGLPRAYKTIDYIFNNVINDIPSEFEIAREAYKKLMSFLDTFCFAENNI